MSSATVIAALGWALLDFLWQGLVVGALAALALLALRNARPQARYAIACIALATCFALPLAGVWRGVAAASTAQTAANGSVASLLLATPIASGTALAASTGDWRQSLQAQLPAIVAAWSAGALLLALRLLLGCRWVGRLRASARLPDSWWQGRFDELAVRVGLRAPVPLRISDSIDSPVAAGWWRPVVLVPAALLAGLPVELMEALLAHELAHVRRRDYLVNLLQGVVETLLFYHPVVWWLSRQVRIEREQVADDLASRALGDPRGLALALQALDRFQQSQRTGPARLPHAPALLPAAHGGKLMSRIKRLLRPDHQRPDWKLALPAAILAALGLAVHAAQAIAPTPMAVPYALVREGHEGINLSGDLDDARQVKILRRHLHGDFLWFRRDGVGYVLQDPALLARVNRAWAPADAISVKMEALSAQMQPHSARMEALGKQMEAYSGRAEPYAHEMEAVGKRMEPLARQQAELGDKMYRLSLAQSAREPGAGDDSTREAAMQRLQAQMDGLSSQMEALSREMEAKSALMQKAHAPMEALGKQMEAAARPMQALGDQMTPLGEQMEVLAHKADAEVVQVIDAALREGKAMPARQLSK
jgi:beta-lactamase regulating signal transducer with metallopeptidase domain/predicted  nucleic acid-binding Zn-ribbon protein